MKLYTVEVICHPERLWDEILGIFVPHGHGQQWVEFCYAKWGSELDFFLPDTSRVYKSRSSAVEKVKTIRRWGGDAQVLVADAEFEPLTTAAKKRETAKKLSRAAELRAQADALEAEVIGK